MPSGDYDRARRLRDLGWDAPPEGSDSVAQLALEAGLLTPDRLEEAVREHERALRRGENVALVDLLVSRGWLKASDVQRLLDRTGREVPALARYELLQKVGEGTTAVVYRGWDRELKRPVALKILREAVAANETARRRFRREAQTAAALSHPHIVPVYDTGEVDGRPFLVMELVEGGSLARRMAQRDCGREELLALLEQAARGVAAAHECGVIHRDLKPGNVLIQASGEAKVGDFGLAHLVTSTTALTRTGTAVGTPLYMAPEQVKGLKELTPATDVYALGAIAYEILTERPPHVGESPAELYAKILGDDPVPPRKLDPALPSDLETITLRALDKDPSRRYADAGAFAEDLRRRRAGEAILARPGTAVDRWRRRLRRNPAAFLLGVGAFLAAAAAVGVWAAGSERARREKARFLSEREEAVATLREVARLSVESALTMRRRGENAAMRAALPPLEEVYQRAAAKAPNLAEVEYLMGRMWRAMMVYDRALACQERALGKDPAFGPAMYERAILLSRRLRDLQFMVPARQQLAAAGNTSNSPVAESLRAESETIRATIVADCEGAERLLRKGNAWLKEANVLSMRGILAFFQGRTAESASLLREAIRRDPTLEEAWETMAEVVAVPVSEAERRDRLGPLARAEACTTEALSHDRGYTPHLHARSRLRCDRAQILAHRGEDPFPDLAAAEEDIARALDLNPDRWESWKQRAIVHTLRGEFRLRRGEVATADWSAAERALSEALRLFPTSTSCWRRLAEIRLHQADDRIRRGEDPAERLERSIEAFTQAAATPGDTAYHLFRCSEARLRLALHRANADADLAAAEADATRAVELWPQFAKAMSQRGHVRRERARRREGAGDAPGAARDYEEAAADYAEALRLTPSLRSDVGAGLEEAQAGARRLRRP